MFFICSLVLYVSTVVHAALTTTENHWVYPTDVYIFRLGDKITPSFVTNLTGPYDVTLWQSWPTMNGADNLQVVKSYPAGSQGQQQFDWTVQIYGADMNFCNLFLLWVNQKGEASGLDSFTSWPFNITVKAASAGSSTQQAISQITTANNNWPTITFSSLPPGAVPSSIVTDTRVYTHPVTSVASGAVNTGSPHANMSTNAPAAATSTLSASMQTSSADATAASDVAIKVGMGVGLGVGIPLVLLLAAIVFRLYSRGKAASPSITDSLQDKLVPPVEPMGRPAVYEKHADVAATELPVHHHQMQYQHYHEAPAGWRPAEMES